MTAFAFYLLKVIICSGVLFIYYYLALRNKLFHQWNRFYLLAGIIISLVAPIVQVTIMHRADEPAKAIQMLQVFESAGGYLETVTISGRPSISMDQWLLMGYIVISGAFLITVLLSFQKIILILRSHTVQWIENIKFVNTKIQETPFSFFNFIFWNEDIDIQTETGQQIFEHELVHVKEKHTVDKLFVQLVLIVFWCNPFFWLIRRELKIIHEFIADKKAVGEHGTAALAAMILSSSYPSHFNSLTNQFFQTSIKRRIAMLAKIQNPRINYLSRILAFSIIVFTVLAFTLRTKALNTNSVKLEKAITVVIDAGHGLMENGQHSGAKADDIFEDDITLAIANKIKELNTNEQIKIVFTRPTEKITDLHKRVDIARENNADLFLSLHLNALPPNSGTGLEKEVSGFEIYVSKKPNPFQQKSEILGSVLSEELNSVYPTETSLYKPQTGVWVLDQNVCPSVLVEFGWLTTKKDRDFITKESNQKAVAQKILEAIERYALNSQTSQSNLILDNLIDTVPKKQVTVREVTLSNPTASNQDNGIKFRSVIDSLNPPLIILDGKEIAKDDLAKINADEIMSMTVLKGQTAMGMYGEKAKNGVIEILSKNNIEVKEITLPRVDTIPQKNNQNKVKEIFIDGQKLRPDEVRFSRISWEQAKKSKSIVVLNDGEKVFQSINDVNISPSEIVSIHNGQGLPLVKEYGDKAATGVIFIDTKNYKSTGPDPIFSRVEIEASVNQKEWIRHLQKNLLSVIESATSKGIGLGTYTVQVKFLVLKDGTVTDVKALNDPGYGLADGAVNVVENGPKWNPGLQNGSPVNSYHTQPITFVINQDPVTKLPEIKLNELIKMDRLDIQNVVSFYLAFERADGGLVTYPNPSMYFDKTAKSLLKQVRPGTIITFERIIVKENNKEIRKPAIAYRVIQ